jgi:hypothetical protein
VIIILKKNRNILLIVIMIVVIVIFLSSFPESPDIEKNIIDIKEEDEINPFDRQDKDEVKDNENSEVIDIELIE